MAPKEKVIISKCMLGYRCRYDGKSKPLPPEVIKKIEEKFELIPFCPEEVALPTPRPPARFIGDKIVDIYGVDKTPQFLQGAREAVKLAKEKGAVAFIGKEKSPSCGINLTSAYINGSECKCKAKGLTSRLMEENGIKLISEWEFYPPER
jgi:uncharacterized protein YbbK (DUF523 family)